jgi:hypothetical protein
MALNPVKTKRKTSSRSRTVQDLAAKKNPKGGAQKKESPLMGGATRGGPLRSAKRNLS